MLSLGQSPPILRHLRCAWFPVPAEATGSKERISQHDRINEIREALRKEVEDEEANMLKRIEEDRDAAKAALENN